WRRCCSGRIRPSLPPSATIFAKRRESRKLLRFRPHIGALMLEVIGDSAAKARIGDVMRGVGRHGHVAAGDLVLALRAGFDARESAPDRVFDGLIVADLEMQEGAVLDRAPVAAVDRVRAEE